jgi:hypothetical protein
LHTTNIAARKRFRDSKGDELLSSQNIRYKLGLLLRRPKVKYGREADDSAAKKTINETSRTKPRKLGVENELRGDASKYEWVGTGRAHTSWK